MGTLKKGDLLNEGKYRIEKTIGRGSFGSVYLAIDKKDNKLVNFELLF